MMAFDYNKLTIGDFRAMAMDKDNPLPFLAAIAHCTTTDIYALPLHEMYVLFQQFSAGLTLYAQGLRAKWEDEELTDAMRLLRGLFGQEGGN